MFRCKADTDQIFEIRISLLSSGLTITNVPPLIAE
jgi:hypothetical protein